MNMPEYQVTLKHSHTTLIWGYCPNLLGWNTDGLNQIHLIIRQCCLLVIGLLLLLLPDWNICTSSTNRCSWTTNVQFTIVSIDALLKKIQYSILVLLSLQKNVSYRQWSSFLFLSFCQTDSVTDHHCVFVAKVFLDAFGSSGAFRHDLA